MNRCQRRYTATTRGSDSRLINNCYNGACEKCVDRESHVRYGCGQGHTNRREWKQRQNKINSEINSNSKYFFEHLNEGSGDVNVTRNRHTTNQSDVENPRVKRAARQCSCCCHKLHEASGQIHCDNFYRVESASARNYERVPQASITDRFHKYHYRNFGNDTQPLLNELDSSELSSRSQFPVDHTSRSHLNMMQFVHKMKPRWERIVADMKADVKCKNYRPRNRLTHHHKCQKSDYNKHGKAKIRESSSDFDSDDNRHGQMYTARKSKSDIMRAPSSAIGYETSKSHPGGRQRIQTQDTHTGHSLKRFHKEEELQLDVGSTNWEENSETDLTERRKRNIGRREFLEKSEDGQSGQKNYDYHFKQFGSSAKEGSEYSKVKSMAHEYEYTIDKNSQEKELQERKYRQFVETRQEEETTEVRTEIQIKQDVTEVGDSEIPMLSKYSQTQAELELDFRLLQRNQQKTETKSSQTEVVIQKTRNDTKIEKDDSWDDWVSATSKGKSRIKKHRKRKQSNYYEYSDKATQTISENIGDSETAKYSVPSIERQLGKSLPTYFSKTTEIALAPRKSYSSAAIPGSGREYIQNSIQSKIPFKYENKIKFQEEGKSHNHSRTHISKERTTLVDGLKVLRHSKSLSETVFKSNVNRRITNANPCNSVISAPPFKSHGQGHDQVRNDSIVKDVNEASDLSEFVTVTGSTSFAMELGSGPIYTDKTLEELSKYYDNLVTSDIVIKGLDVQESTVSLNQPLEEMRKASITNLTLEQNSSIIRTPRSGKEIKFIWRSHSFHGQNCKICQQCKEMIQDAEEFIESKAISSCINLSWHMHCFQCTKCGITLKTNNNPYLFGNRVYCEKHYVEKANFPKCHACHEYIFEDKYTLARGNTWHTDHFNCSRCQEPIVDSKFVKSHEYNFCFDCHMKLFSKQCVGCKRTITATEQFVQSKDQYWHAKDYCFHCFTCHKNLVEQNRMFQRNGITYCNRYCALMNVPPV